MIILSNQEAFARVYTKYFPRLVVFARPYTGAVESAEDIVQDVFEKLHGLDNSFDSEARLSSFLYKSVRNRAIDHLRAQRPVAGIDAGVEAAYTDEHLLNDELDGDLLYLLAQSVEGLPPQARKVVELLFENDLSYKDAAEALAISPNTVRNMRKFALDLLRKKFSHQRIVRTIFFFYFH